MNLTCRFHVGLADSWHFQGTFPMSLSRHSHVTFMANPNMAKGESTMNLPWKCHETVWGAMFGLEMKMTRKWHESAMKAPWKCHESGMTLIWIWHEYDTMDFDNFSWQIHGTFMALSFKDSKTVEIYCITFISYSCRFHAIFMALSWHFQPNRAPNSFMPFSWHFSWKLFQNGYIWLYHVCVCVYLSSGFLFFFWYFFIYGFSGWSKFFCLFFDQNIGL